MFGDVVLIFVNILQHDNSLMGEAWIVKCSLALELSRESLVDTY